MHVKHVGLISNPLLHADQIARACAIARMLILYIHTRHDQDTQVEISKLWTNYINLGTRRKALNIYGNLAT